MPEKYFRIEGPALYVVHDGPTTLPGAAPEVGPEGAVLALHDAGRHGFDFSKLRNAFADHDTTSQPHLISFDQPAHGRSSELDSLGDVGALAELTQKLIERLKLDRPWLLGHGLGGAVALRVALDRPALVRGVVVIGCGLRLPVADDVYETMLRVTQGKERRPFDVTQFAKGTSPDVMRACFMEGLKTDPRATFGDLAACRAWDDSERLGALSVPLLVVVGESETEPMRARADALVATVPDAKLEVIEGAGHMLPIEAPEAVADLLCRHFESRP